MAEYRPNSNKYNEMTAQNPTKPPEKKRESVVTGNVTVKEKSVIRKVFDIFFAKDLEDVGDYLVKSVIVPEMRDILYSLIDKGTQMFLYGEARSKRGPSTPGAVRVNYNKYYDQSRPTEPAPKSRNGMNFDNVTFEEIADAEEVLNQMIDILEDYKSVSVADFCDLANITDEYTDRKYGWTNLSRAEVRRTSGGEYYIKLPKAMLLP